MLSHIWLFVTPRTAAHQAFLSFTISWMLYRHIFSILGGAFWCQRRKTNSKFLCLIKIHFPLIVVVIQLPSYVQLFATPWAVACQAPLFSTVSWSLLKFRSVELVMLSTHLILCYPLLLWLPSIFPSSRVFSKEWTLSIRWPKCWSFSISPSNEYSGLNSFRITWFDLLAVQGTLKSLIQHHNSKASIDAFKLMLSK